MGGNEAGATAPALESPALELRGIVKHFGDVVANEDVSLSLAHGQVIGILGENGAGKSTLMNIVSGLTTPDKGEILIDGRPVDLGSPRAAMAYGVGMVHQHFMLVPALTVVENVMLGQGRSGGLRLPTAKVAAEISRLGDEIGMRIDPHARISDLGVGDQQRVEIVRALLGDARILILDEPTTVLTNEERERLFEIVRQLRGQGRSVILISHKLDDIFAICDRVVVLRRGRVVDERAIGEATRDGLVEAMVGADLPHPEKRATGGGAAAVLQVEAIAATGRHGERVFENASFDLRAGEILALAGVEGNGQRELAEIVAGLRSPSEGSVRFLDVPLDRRTSPRHLRRRGLRHVPEDRLASGVLPGEPLFENHLLSHFFRRPYARRGWLSRRRARETVADLIREFDVRAPRPEVAMTTLSGGNQQKLVLGRELDGDIRVLIAAHPTRGLDLRTNAFIQEKLLDLRENGVGVLLISSDLEEIWEVADRIMVLAGGRLHGPVALTETTVQAVGAWMSGR